MLITLGSNVSYAGGLEQLPVAGVATLQLSGRATNMRQLQAEDLLNLRSVGDVRTSPTENRLVFVEEWQDAEHNTSCQRIRTVIDGGSPIDLTQGTSDSHPRFRPDGRALAFLRKTDSVAQVWILPLNGGEALCVTHYPGGVDSFSWSPDGQSLAVVGRVKRDGAIGKSDPTLLPLRERHTSEVKVITELLHKFDGDGYFDPYRPNLFTVALADNNRSDQLTHHPYRVSEAQYMPDGSAIVFRSRRGDDYDRGSDEGLFSIDLISHEITELVSPGAQAFLIAPDGSLVYSWEDPATIGYDQPRLYTRPRGATEALPVAATFEYPIGNEAINDVLSPAGDTLVWDKPGESLFALISQQGSVEVVHISLASDTVAKITTGHHVISSFARSTTTNELYAVITTSSQPSEVYRLLDGDKEQVTTTNASLTSEVSFIAPDYFQAQTSEGHSVDTWVYLPPKSYTEPVPGVVEIHGGPMAMYAHAFFFEFQLLASQGFAVIASNPRGSRGYGASFCSAIFERWGDRDWADIETAVDAACERHPEINQDALGVGGGSYGGYMTAWIIGHSNRYSAAVVGRPVTDWVSMVGSSDVGWDEARRAGGKHPWEDDSWYRQQSPLTYVEQVRTPVLIEAQEGDLRCPIEQAMEYYTAIRYLNRVPVRFVRYPDEFHGMSRNGKPWNRIHRLDEILNWYNRFLTTQPL
ncbi:S9 family peptidase [Ferrimicrobium acidiphilum]|uniref:S9 family peptidase n=1 Tax=Ferrimicrobium acidiphilum TaxID=121039 RepID=UPI0023EFF551|nr:S9 family peptidase [Ferrimicrobium acidiphilum]